MEFSSRGGLGNPRDSRLEVCATKPAGFHTGTSGRFNVGKSACIRIQIGIPSGKISPLEREKLLLGHGKLHQFVLGGQDGQQSATFDGVVYAMGSAGVCVMKIACNKPAITNMEVAA